MHSKLESRNATLMLKNSGASMLMQNCSVFTPASLPRDEIQARMLESEAKAVTSLTGCNISASSSYLSGGSITKVVGCLIGAPPLYFGENAAFNVNHSGTKLLALGKSYSNKDTFTQTHYLTTALQPLLLWLGLCWRLLTKKRGCSWNE